MSELQAHFDFQARGEDDEKVYVSVQHHEVYHGEDVCIFLSEEPLSGTYATIRMTRQQAGRLGSLLSTISRVGADDPDEDQGKEQIE